MIQLIKVILFKISAIFFLFSFFLFPFKSVFAATFNVAAGDVYGPNGLVATINQANSNNETDTINLTAGSTYSLTSIDNIVEGENNGLPQITSEIVINGNGATVERDTTSSSLFRLLFIATSGKLTLNDLVLKNGYAQAYYGGGIFNGGSLTLNHSTVSNNYTNHRGGAIYLGVGSSLAVQGGSLISNNFGGNWGGGIYTENDSIVKIVTSTIADNTSGIGGGINNNGVLTIDNSTLTGNKDNGGFIRVGGAIYNGSGAKTTIIHSQISNNQMVDALGGGIFNEQGGTATISGTTISSNLGGSGGGIYNQVGASLDIANSTFSDHHANQAGGILNRGTLTLTNSTLSGNSASGGFRSFGGGLYNLIEGTATIKGVTFVNNTTSLWCGGIANEGGILNIEDSRIEGNYAGGTAGGLCSNGGPVTVKRTVIANNTATYYGGGIWNNSSNLILDNVTLSGNKVLSQEANWGLGGAIYITAGTVTATNSRFSGNSGNIGGAIMQDYLAGELRIDSSVFTQNSATSGRGGAIAYNNSQVVGNVGNNCFVGNTGISVHNAALPALEATNSWWGTATGPTHSSNPAGTGDSVSDYVNFMPWLTSAPTFCPNLYLNRPPTANAGGPYSVPEGGTVTLNGSGSDPDGDPLTFAWDLDNNGTFETIGQSVTFSAAGLDGPSSKTVVLQVCDNKSACATANASVTITNVAPAVGIITAPLDPVLVNTAISANANFTDPGVLDTHTAVWDWGDGSTSAGAVTEVNGSGSVTGNHTYTTAGVFTLKLTVTDKDGASGQSVFQYVVVYDPSAGFVTGGGLIDSPAGAYVPDQSLSNKANIGFSIKYQPGVTVPTGQTQFHLKDALRFQSTSYEWLVVSGSKAQFKGAGTINDGGNYTFLVTVIDGQITGGGGVDKFRIKIVDNANNTVVYDNQMGAIDTADPTTTLLAGNIVIH